MNKTRTFIALMVVGLVLAFAAGCGDGLNPAPNGEACEVGDDCESAICLLELGNERIVFPDGLCTTECDINDEDSCGEGEICLIYNSTGQSNCYQSCDSLADCPRDGYFCQQVGFVDYACLPEF